ncbi:hypothetical protein CFR79_13080 [Komagataeibacter saccharivorans]|nr:hypothetical protein CFR79_13080 [Komagataeibacter saccharivorans]
MALFMNPSCLLSDRAIIGGLLFLQTIKRAHPVTVSVWQPSGRGGAVIHHVFLKSICVFCWNFQEITDLTRPMADLRGCGLTCTAICNALDMI